MAEAGIVDQDSFNDDGECGGEGDKVVYDDDDEFNCGDEEDEDDLTKSFNAACEHIKSLVPLLRPAQLLEFYGLYKQAVVGPCTTPRPGWFAFEAKQKWDAWNKLGDMSKTDAMNRYVTLLKQFDTGGDKMEANSKSFKNSWVAVSSMTNGDDHINDEDKTVYDWVKENNLVKLRQYIRGRDVNNKDAEGMGLVHWAADRGNLGVIKFLIEEMKADIDMCDADGQTALHYAASCGHKDVLKFLVDNGADKTVTDNDGTLPKDVASDKDIEIILS